ncbi:hypothetical protein HK104_006805 [Borealophlyctis nickersoniae]|nr:hypothetical protein HK104_006805 [Borealophlyctis nickersoniae]
MDDAATIISNCRRLLSDPHTITETDARAAAAACEAWLKEHHPRPRPRLPPEILNKIFRLLPYDYYEKAAMLACSSVNKEWRRHAWPHVWKKVKVSKKSLASTASQFSLPWALDATEGIHVRDLIVGETEDSLDYLPSLLAAPVFTGLRRLCLDRDGFTNPLHLLVAFRSLPNLTYLQAWGVRYGRVALGSNLGLSDQEENETWRIGFGNLKALHIEVASDGVMLEKLAMGLGSRLESLRIRLFWPAEESPFGRFLSMASQNCPNLVDLEVDIGRWGWDSVHRFLTTQQQLVSLILRDDPSDDTIRTVAASCPNLKILYVHAGEDLTSQCFQHLASGPSLRGLHIDDYGGDPIAEEDFVHFLRHRGRDLHYLNLPFALDCALARLTEFLPNIRHLDAGSWYDWGYPDAGSWYDWGYPDAGSWYDWGYPFATEDVTAFLNGAQKLERLWINPDGIPHQIREAAIARKVELCTDDFELPDYAEFKMESWMGP